MILVIYIVRGVRITFGGKKVEFITLKKKTDQLICSGELSSLQ